VEQQEVPDEQKNLKAISPGRTMADAQAIQRLSHYAAHVSPVCTLRPEMTYQGNSSYVDLRGVTQEVLPVDRYRVDRGRFLCDSDLMSDAQVIVLGSSQVKDLFKGHQDPMGQTVMVNREPFRVIGLLHDYVSMDGKYNMLQQKDEVAFIPITTMQHRLLGTDQIDELNVRVNNTDNLGRLVEEIDSILLGTHRGVQDFKAYSEQENIQQYNAMKAGFFMVGCGVGAVTLLVGGIGIMNLMLASINERVREIGIRKAIGAWNRDIFAQFMAEAVALSVVGGLAGVAVGVMAIRILRHAASGSNGQMPPPALSIPAVVVGLAFSVVVGITAGIYPAFRASRLDPIEALRYE
jgi:ABC-type antimicrobial peptide transport system permease subunit